MIFTSNGFVPSGVEFVLSVSAISTVAVPDVTSDLAFKVIVPTVLLPPVLL